MKRKKVGLCFVLFFVDLQAKSANQWCDLNEIPIPNPTNITVFEDSTLSLSVNNDFFKNNGAYGGGIAINHHLSIVATLLEGDKSFLYSTTIYKTLEQGVAKSIAGDNQISLRISGIQEVKKLFDIDNGGKLAFDADMSAGIRSNQSLFSLFHIGSGSAITFTHSLNIDISNASAGFALQDLKAIKPIFDIADGSVVIGSKDKDVILKGDIFSSGTLDAQFNTDKSLFNGNLILKGDSKTNLVFDNASSANGEFDLRDQSEIKIQMDNKSRIDGRFHALGDVKSHFSVKNQAVVSMDVRFDWHSRSTIELLGGEWEGKIAMAGDGAHTMTLKNSSSFIGDLYVLSSAKLDLKSSSSKIIGSISATGDTVLKGKMSERSRGKFDLTLTQSSNADFTFDSQSQYEGKIKLSGKSNSKLLIDSNASFSSEVSIADTPSFLVDMKGGSTSKAKFIFDANSAPKKSQIFVDNAIFLGSILQDTPKYAQVELSNNAIWYIQESSQVNTLDFKESGSVDFTTTGFDKNKKRTLSNINEDNRIVLKTEKITGNQGTFNLFGILNRNSWGVDSKGGRIATDKIITSALSGKHKIKIFWDLNGLDTSLLDANLYDDHIVVAEQNGKSGGGEFVGAMSEIGVYQYNTKLTKIEKKDANDNVIGYKWILGERDNPPNEPPMVLPPNPKPPQVESPQVEPKSPQAEPAPIPQPPMLEAIPPESQPLVFEPDPIPQAEIIHFPPQSPTPSKLELSLSARLINTLLSSQYKIWHFQVENLHARLGDLRNLTTSFNLWAKAKYGLMLGEEDDELIASKQMNTTLAFGGDYSFYTPYGRNFVGGGFDVSFYQDFGGELEGSEKAYKGSSTSFGVSVYDTFLFHNGIYLDSVLKYYFSSNEFSINLNELSANSPKFSHHAFIASLEIGKKFRLPIPTSDFSRSFYYLKPELGASVGYLKGVSVEFSHLGGYALSSTLSASTPFQTRVGLDMGRRFDSEKVLGDVFIGFGCEYTALSKGDVKIASPINEVNLKSKGLFNLKLGVGGNVMFDDRVRMNFNVDSKFLGYIQPVFNLNIGVRIALGERIRATPRGSEAEQIPASAEYIYLN